MRLAFALVLLPEVKGMRPEFMFLDEPLGSYLKASSMYF